MSRVANVTSVIDVADWASLLFVYRHAVSKTAFSSELSGLSGEREIFSE